MDVAHPSRALTPTLDGPVLVALAGHALPLNLTQVAEQAGQGSVSGVRKTLMRLVEQGLVQAVPGGYLLNRQHLAAAAVMHLAGMRAELMSRIGSYVDSWTTQPELVGVYGSFARKDGDSDSDIDIVLVLSDAGLQDHAGDLAESVRTWTGNPCHVLTLTSADIRRMRRNREPILREWESDLIVVRGGREVVGI